MKNILIHSFLRRELVKEFNCSKPTIDNSLKFMFNSEKSKAIRQRAKEMLKAEIKKIDQSEKGVVKMRIDKIKK